MLYTWTIHVRFNMAVYLHFKRRVSGHYVASQKGEEDGVDKEVNVVEGPAEAVPLVAQ